MDPAMVALITCATISVICSMSVVMTLIFFRRLRGQFLMQLVAFVSVGDIIGNFPYIFPYRQSQGWWCSLQAIMNLTGYPMAWLWTVALVFSLYRVAVIGKLPTLQESRIMHSICWLLPIFLALLQLSVSDYRGSGTGLQVCTHEKTHQATIYHDVAYYGLFYFCVLVMITLLILIQRVQSNQSQVALGTFQVAKSALHWYPFLVLIFWLPHSLSSMVGRHYSRLNRLYDFGLTWRVFHGMITALVFFRKSSEARRLWWQATLGKIFLQKNVDDMRAPAESIIDIHRDTDASMMGLSFVEFNPQIKNAMHNTDSIVDIEDV